MGIQAEVSVSNVAASDWRPDRETGGEMHVLFEGEDTYVGMTRFLDIADVGPLTLPARESFLILEGAAHIEIADGPTLELAAGDMASIPEGATVTWRLTLPFKEMWFFGRAYEMAAEQHEQAG
jgi:ethanolamine utilization protein EutQ (cupin superfamily)